MVQPLPAGLGRRRVLVHQDIPIEMAYDTNAQRT